jgi:hypothetical protein
MPIDCLFCGTTLIDRSTRAKYCNSSCKSHHVWRTITAKRKENGIVSSADLSTKMCRDCGRPFQSCRAIQYRCPNCQKESLKVRKRRGPCEIPATCAVCGDRFAADRRGGKICPKKECRAERKRKLANSLTSGRSTGGNANLVCVVCECDFTGHHNTIVCSRKCRLARLRELSRRRLEIDTYRCVSCTSEIPPEKNGRTYRYTCSENCRKLAMSAKNRRSYTNNPHIRERSVAARRERKQADPEYAKHLADLDRQRRERQTQEKFQVELASLEAKLKERKL